MLRLSIISPPEGTRRGLFWETLRIEGWRSICWSRMGILQKEWGIYTVFIPCVLIGVMGALGTFFKEGTRPFFSRESHLLEARRYVALNPVRALVMHFVTHSFHW